MFLYIFPFPVLLNIKSGSCQYRNVLKVVYVVHKQFNEFINWSCACPHSSPVATVRLSSSTSYSWNFDSTYSLNAVYVGHS